MKFKNLKFQNLIFSRTKRVFEVKLSNLLLKQKSTSLPRNLVLGTFVELLIVFSTKLNLPIFNSAEVLPSASDKTKFFAKNFSENSNLDYSGIYLPAFSSRTNLKLQNISTTAKKVKKAITNLDSSKVSGHDFIPVVVL